MNKLTERSITKFTIILSAAFYITSLTQTAYCTIDCKSSFLALLIGLLGIITELGALINFIIDRLNGHTDSMINELGATFTWFANPIILLSLFIFRHTKRMALILSLISTILILMFMAFDKIIDNEAGHYSKVTEVKLGYWFWLLSSLTIVIGSLTILKRAKLDH